jgi:hypothetical protein
MWQPQPSITRRGPARGRHRLRRAAGQGIALAALALTGALSGAQVAAAATPPVVESASNAVVTVTFDWGWSVESTSTSNSLLLSGPDQLSILFFTAQDKSSATLQSVLASDLASRQKFTPTARVCELPKAEKVPGTPSVPGVSELMCLSVTSSSGATTEYEDLASIGLVKDHGGQLQLEVDAAFPVGTPGTTIEKLLIPVVYSARWDQLLRS